MELGLDCLAKVPKFADWTSLFYVGSRLRAVQVPLGVEKNICCTL